MRVQPKPWIGIVVLLAYLAVFYGIWILTGIDYHHIGDNEDTLLKWYVAPLAGGAVVLVIAASTLGWWKPSLVEKQRAPRWLVIPGVLLLAAGIAVIFLGDRSGLTTTALLYLALGSIGVGFCEEMATRGTLIVGLRGRFTEPGVWLFSTLLFMALHIPNAFFGEGAGVVIQLPLTFGAGTIFYLLRRSTGTLIAPMVVHGVWDFGAIGGEQTTASSSIAVPADILLGILAVIFVLIMLRRERGTRIEQFGAATR